MCHGSFPGTWTTIICWLLSAMPYNCMLGYWGGTSVSHTGRVPEKRAGRSVWGLLWLREHRRRALFQERCQPLTAQVSTRRHWVMSLPRTIKLVRGETRLKLGPCGYVLGWDSSLPFKASESYLFPSSRESSSPHAQQRVSCIWPFPSRPFGPTEKNTPWGPQILSLPKRDSHF